MGHSESPVLQKTKQTSFNLSTRSETRHKTLTINFGAVVFLLVLFASPVTAQDQSIGKLFGGGLWSLKRCTATLVTPATLLTAAHCVTLPDGRARSPIGLGFVAGWDGKRHETAGSVEQIVLHPDAIQEGEIDFAHDLAILRLNRALPGAPVNTGITAPIGIFSIVGYPREAPDSQTRREDCHGKEQNGFWILTCSVSKGMSGGPVFFSSSEGQRIVGVISASADGEAIVAPVDKWVIREVARTRTP